VEKASCPARARHGDATYHFCSDGCRDRFTANPERFAKAATSPAETVSAPQPAGTATAVVDPVCGMTVSPESAAAHRRRGGVDHWFCSAGCAERFDASAAGAVAGSRGSGAQDRPE
ncbi:MAG: YHS domain-containing protein, partial [Candidatus Dormibacteria bacterium]